MLYCTTSSKQVFLEPLWLHPGVQAGDAENTGPANWVMERTVKDGLLRTSAVQYTL